MSIQANTDPTGMASLADLRRSARAGDASAAREAAKQFEALFVNMMIKQMREAMPTSGGLFGGDGMKLYQGMHDQQLAQAMARRGGIGLAESIERQLLPAGTQAAGSAPAGAAPRELHFPTHRLPARVTPLVRLDPPASTPADSGWPSSPAEFVQRLLPHARRAAARLGVAPEVLIAQSALETGWGRHVMADGSGKPSHNLFGIKATGGWSGDSVRVSTLEYRDGVARRELARFRGYADEAASFADYVRLIGDNPRYRKALENAHSAEGYLRGLQEAGYATDPAYADKILKILERGLPGLNFPASRPTTTHTGGPEIARARPHPAAEENT